MALFAAGIAALATVAGSAISGSAGRDAARIAADKDTRETSLEELFSESFLSSLTVGERTALEEQVTTGELSSISEILSTEQASTAETGTVSGTESATGTEVSTTTGGNIVQRGSEASAQALQDIIQGGSQPSGSAAIQASIDRVLRSGAPAVAAAGGKAGAFDSTVQAQLSNDLIVRAAEAGALTDLSQQNTNTQNLLAAIASSQAGQEAVETTQQVAAETSQDTASAQVTASQVEAITQALQQQQQQQQTTQQQTTQQQEQTQQAAEQTQQQAQQSLSDVFVDVSGDAGINRDTPLGALTRTEAGNIAIGASETPARTSPKLTPDRESQDALNGEPEGIAVNDVLQEQPQAPAPAPVEPVGISEEAVNPSQQQLEELLNPNIAERIRRSRRGELIE